MEPEFTQTAAAPGPVNLLGGQSEAGGPVVLAYQVGKLQRFGRPVRLTLLGGAAIVISFLGIAGNILSEYDYGRLLPRAAVTQDDAILHYTGWVSETPPPAFRTITRPALRVLMAVVGVAMLVSIALFVAGDQILSDKLDGRRNLLIYAGIQLVIIWLNCALAIRWAPNLEIARTGFRGVRSEQVNGNLIVAGVSSAWPLIIAIVLFTPRARNHERSLREEHRRRLGTAAGG